MKLIEKFGMMNAVIVLSVLISAVTFGFLVAPHVAMIVTSALVGVGVILAVLEALSPSVPGSPRHRITAWFRVPGTVVLGVFLSGFLTLCLFIAPMVWICVAGYAAFVILTTVPRRQGSNVEQT